MLLIINPKSIPSSVNLKETKNLLIKDNFRMIKLQGVQCSLSYAIHIFHLEKLSHRSKIKCVKFQSYVFIKIKKYFMKIQNQYKIKVGILNIEF